jgi:hypothetical protein
MLIKIRSKQDRRDGRVKKSWTCLREAASAKAGRQPFIFDTQADCIPGTTRFSASAD